MCEGVLTSGLMLRLGPGDVVASLEGAGACSFTKEAAKNSLRGPQHSLLGPGKGPLLGHGKLFWGPSGALQGASGAPGGCVGGLLAGALQVPRRQSNTTKPTNYCVNLPNNTSF